MDLVGRDQGAGGRACSIDREHILQIHGLDARPPGSRGCVVVMDYEVACQAASTSIISVVP